MNNKEKKYSINWTSLSNDKLLDLWVASTLPNKEDREIVENILKDRNVIREDKDNG